jgi:hypothetical protein
VDINIGYQALSHPRFAQPVIAFPDAMYHTFHQGYGMFPGVIAIEYHEGIA